MDTDRFQHDFMSRVHNPWQFADLLEHIPDVCFFSKNRDSQFVMGNNQFLDLLGVNNVHDAVGKTDHDFFESSLAGQYIDEDRHVVDSGLTISNQLWMVPNLKLGTVSWFRSTKMPIYSSGGRIIGIAGVMKNEDGNSSPVLSCNRIMKVVNFMSLNFQKRISLDELASVASMSVSQFERRFRQVCHVSPVKYLAKIRVDSACRALRRSVSSLADIALESGFYDQSHFCRQFKKHTGLTPLQYRETRGLGNA
ncbi:MAG: hypothetical protein A2283_09500 [Lentisphaerae bacterium RIFOXYA12_FULL_48_11]|nr:MAG: hypothetical protein A2283_09500 [Lentisphaerae bacterium RIFOXYA12_FULL_48_11]